MTYFVFFLLFCLRFNSLIIKCQNDEYEISFVKVHINGMLLYCDVLLEERKDHVHRKDQISCY